MNRDLNLTILLSRRRHKPIKIHVQYDAGRRRGAASGKLLNDADRQTRDWSSIGHVQAMKAHPGNLDGAWIFYLIYKETPPTAKSDNAENIITTAVPKTKIAHDARENVLCTKKFLKVSFCS